MRTDRRGRRVHKNNTTCHYHPPPLALQRSSPTWRAGRAADVCVLPDGETIEIAVLEDVYWGHCALWDALGASVYHKIGQTAVRITLHGRPDRVAAGDRGTDRMSSNHRSRAFRLGSISRPCRAARTVERTPGGYGMPLRGRRSRAGQRAARTPAPSHSGWFGSVDAHPLDERVSVPSNGPATARTSRAARTMRAVMNQGWSQNYPASICFFFRECVRSTV